VNSHEKRVFQRVRNAGVAAHNALRAWQQGPYPEDDTLSSQVNKAAQMRLNEEIYRKAVQELIEATSEADEILNDNTPDPQTGMFL
jgi:hypothetical protein